MPRRLYLFDEPDRLVAGTVGPPGARAFYLQAAKGALAVTVGLEKVQVAALAQRLGDLIEEVRRRGMEQFPLGVRSGSTPLREPIDEAFKVGTMALGWDNESERVIIEARALTDEEDDDDEVPDDDENGPDLVRIRIPPGDALRFAERAAEVVAAGRPPCPVCGEPLNPEGHICARRNGYVN